MALSHYITHPEVAIDPDIPVPYWGLREKGVARAKAFAARIPFPLPPNAVFVSSEETKAEELAEILAAPNGNAIVTREDLGENDRSATGFVQPERFEKLADQFFARPDDSIEGWETAQAAQARVLAGVTAALAEFGNTPLVFVGHGGVGTLLKCALAGRAISREEDQSRRAHGGGGNLYAFDLAAGRLLCDWTAMENWEGI